MRIINKIKNYLVSQDLVKQYNRQLELRTKYFIRAEHLKECIYKCKERGTTDETYCEHEVIVSLTTFGKRFYDVATTIESIMQGSMLPNRIILWLAEEEFNDVILPHSLQLQQKRGLEIRYCKDIRSYKKLIPTLKKYPDAVVITVDDDVLYEADLIENLFRSFKANPGCICAGRVHKITLDDYARPLGYLRWEWGKGTMKASTLNFFTGVGGVLYPPHCLDEEVFNEAIFTDICKHADDIWFYAMAKKRGTNIVKCFTHNPEGGDYLINEDVQDVGLSAINVCGQHLNDTQFQAVFEYYNLHHIYHQYHLCR